ncbi:hypothetical protein P20311_0213 [Pseudoalteromonas sp. BSi20311]|nr:hypothetical protein P20311_0213 [Pseudoalteromonas sp. BSi20311]
MRSKLYFYLLLNVQPPPLWGASLTVFAQMNGLMLEAIKM